MGNTVLGSGYKSHIGVTGLIHCAEICVGVIGCVCTLLQLTVYKVV